MLGLKKVKVGVINCITNGLTYNQVKPIVNTRKPKFTDTYFVCQSAIGIVDIAIPNAFFKNIKSKLNISEDALYGLMLQAMHCYFGSVGNTFLTEEGLELIQANQAKKAAWSLGKAKESSNYYIFSTNLRPLFDCPMMKEIYAPVVEDSDEKETEADDLVTN